MPPTTDSNPETETKPVHFILVFEAEIATTQIIEIVFEYLSGSSLTYEKKLLSDLKVSDIKPGTVIFFIRCASPIMGRWAKLLKSAHAPFVYLIDDNFWEIQGSNSVSAYYSNPRVRDSLDEVVESASTIVTNSIHLGEYISNRGGTVITLPAYFDMRNLNKRAKQNLKPEFEIRIGFAASQGREADLIELEECLVDFLSTHREVFVEFIGVQPAKFRNHEKARFFDPIPDYKSFLQFIQSRNWDIGLAPLGDSVSNAYKTNNKYREYGALRIPAVYSDSVAYRDSVVDGKTGLIARDANQWKEAIANLIKDKGLRESIANQAFVDVDARFSLDALSAMWKSFLIQPHHRVTRENLEAIKKQRCKTALTRHISKIEDVLLRFRTIAESQGFRVAFKTALRHLLKLIGVLYNSFGSRLKLTATIAYNSWPIRIPREVIDTVKIGGPKLLKKKIKQRLGKKSV